VTVGYYGSFAKRTMSATSPISTSAKTKYPFFLSHCIDIYASGIIVAHARPLEPSAARTRGQYNGSFPDRDAVNTSARYRRI
jgi:hypothetical protein